MTITTWFIYMVSIVIGYCKHALGRGSSSSGYKTKLEQSTFSLRYLWILALVTKISDHTFQDWDLSVFLANSRESRSWLRLSDHRTNSSRTSSHGKNIFTTVNHFFTTVKHIFTFVKHIFTIVNTHFYNCKHTFLQL
jgi:hypothetical protein